MDKNIRLEAIGLEVAKLTSEKNLAYGDAAFAVEAMMHILYPNGIPSEGMTDALLITRILDKICRVAKGNKAAFGESPYRDIAGYGILGAEKDERS